MNKPNESINESIACFEEYVSKMINQEDETLDEKFIKEFLFSFESEDEFCIAAEKLIEWKVFTLKSNIKRQLGKMKCIEGKDFYSQKIKSTGGRPSENIMLSIDCFKKLCIMAKNSEGEKVRTYYLVLEKLFKKYSKEEFDRQIEEKNRQLEEQRIVLEEEKEKALKLSTELTDEQTNAIKLKKSLTHVQKSFMHRHQFSKGKCVYILSDPDCKYGKFKIGLTQDINQRLKSDRTMIPSIKVCSIFFTEYCELFERIIKVRFCEQLELPSHEWVFESLENLIIAYKEIDKACGFNSTIETDLWKYNLEAPPKKVKNAQVELSQPIQPTQSIKRVGKKAPSKIAIQTRNEPKNIPNYQNNMEENLDGFLPTRLLRCDYVEKNKIAPQGQRYCNGFCQVYQPLETFNKRSASYLTICKYCETMTEVAKIKVANGVLTAQQIRNDPSKLNVKDDEQICKKCNQVLNKREFPEKRLQCKKCRNSVRSKFGKKFDNVLESEIETLKGLEEEEMSKKIDGYVRDELYKMTSFLNLGRKYNDRKNIVASKLKEYFRELKI